MKKIWQGLLAAGVLAGGAAYIWQRSRKDENSNQINPHNEFLEKYGSWALITGAARAEGIGYGFARRLAGKGLNLVLVDIMGEELEARAVELRSKYLVKVKTVELDLGDPRFIEGLQAETADLEIGMLVCNHMYTPADTPPILGMDLETHHKMIDINARAYTTLVHTYGRIMANRGKGGIIIVSSGSAIVPTPYTGAYSANKAFQRNLGEALWYEMKGTGVDVLVVAPGLTNTQGDALENYPKQMIMEVDPLIIESLEALGKEPMLIPGVVNKWFVFAQTRLMSHRRALESTGEFMAKGLGK